MASEASLHAGNGIRWSRASANPGRTGARMRNRHLLCEARDLGLFVTSRGLPTDVDAAIICHSVQESWKKKIVAFDQVISNNDYEDGFLS